MKKLATLTVVVSAAFAATGPAPAAPAAATGPAAAASPAACPALLQHTFPRLQDEKPQPLCQYAGKVLLVVNTASYCGYTPQYQGLEDLYARYRDKGLVVLGFPSNDFNQEKSSNKEIADFCENTFGVKFPMFGKSSVAGAAANPLFRELAAKTGKAPAWNFHKYLIGRDGKVVAQYASRTTPSDPELLKTLEQQLAAR
ncbi:MAG TPA: glutathione peroxidase [Ramlibacter sp.]|uniref:glutathione peroxidase n=1 Tax=Ramlibacter sp. TaxID=1917967 RepID=UPI002D7F8D76|nr:glutathione peroxidase [Ramlibacter sp.]HET8744542.1 glutathione peroxidase [Ramlibacter sp.]